jgi:hypothetical protein
MDPVEEFNFKPITEGLGFHRKKVELKEQMKTAKVVQDAIGKTVPPKTKATEAPVLRSPLPRKEPVAPASAPTVPSKDVIDELVRNFKKPNETFIEEVNASKVIMTPTSPQMDEASNPLPWMISPFFVDAMLVVALVLSCLLATLLVTKADLLVLIMESPSDLEFWLTFPAIGFGMAFTYMTLTRLFLGASLGEMVFDVQLGTIEQQHNLQYGFQVAWRSFLALATGLLPLPFVSMIMRADYLGSLSGLRLYRKKRRG